MAAHDAELDYEIVICAENSPYLLWQALLFYDSCLETQGIHASVVVHGEGPLLPGFRELAGLGARVVPAPSYRRSREHDYAARNTAGTLLEARSERPWTLICDPDFLFLAPLPRRAGAIHCGRALSWDFVGYMQVSEPNRRWLARACVERGITPACLERAGAGGVVPHLVRSDLCRSFASRWLDAVDALVGAAVPEREPPWLSLPWGFALAAWELGLEPALTRLTQTSYDGGNVPASRLRAPILHYCYGDALFDKRRHAAAEAAGQVWALSAAGSSVSAALVRRLQRARARLAARGLDVTDVRLYEPARPAR